MRAYSTDLREKIVRAYERGEGTLDEMATTFEVARRTVSRLLHRHREGLGLTPQPHGGGYPAILDDKRLKVLQSIWAQIDHWSTSNKVTSCLIMKQTHLRLLQTSASRSGVKSCC